MVLRPRVPEPEAKVPVEREGAERVTARVPVGQGVQRGRRGTQLRPGHGWDGDAAMQTRRWKQTRSRSSRLAVSWASEGPWGAQPGRLRGPEGKVGVWRS